MTKYSHVWIGFLSAIDILKIPLHHIEYIPIPTMLMFISILFGSYFPDIDMFLNRFKWMPYKERTLWSHRGWTHHILFPVVLLPFSIIFSGIYGRLIASFVLGMSVHIVTDIFSPLGIPYGKKYHQRIEIPIYRTGKLSEALFALTLSVFLIIPKFIPNAQAKPSLYDNNTFLQAVEKKSVELKKRYGDNKSKEINNLRKNILIYKDNSTINKRAHRLAIQSYSVFHKRMPEVKQNMSDFLRQQHINLKNLMPEHNKQILANNAYIYIFMSSSIPFATWRNYAFAIDKLRHSGQGNIGLIMRGFIGGAKRVMPTMLFIQRVLTDGNTKLSVPVLIDPYLFRLYKIKRVPVFVYAKNVNLINSTLSAGNLINLKGNITAYKVIGDWSFEYALQRLYRKSGDISLLRLYNILNRNWFEEPEKQKN